MEISATVTFCVIYFIEAVLTLLGNIFTIFVFWKHRAELKRTSYLLVNLAFADLLVAISISFTLSSQVKILVQNVNLQEWLPPGFVFLVSWDMFCEASSLLNLLVISLERLYAVRWPFRHRTLTTRSYIYTLGFIWVPSGLVFVLHFAFLYNSQGDIAVLITSPLFLLVLVIICAAYILIHLQMRQTFPEGRNERRVQQNKKLTKTLLIVTFLSLICWLPAIIMSFSANLLLTVNTLHTNNVVRILKVLQYANSVVNPIVYTFRMSLFKTEIKECFSKLTRAKENHGANRTEGIVTVPKQSRLDDFKLQYFDTKL